MRPQGQRAAFRDGVVQTETRIDCDPAVTGEQREAIFRLKTHTPNLVDPSDEQGNGFYWIVR